jgi:glycine/D-amino acid oxidase-like deaminating enzyme
MVMDTPKLDPYWWEATPRPELPEEPVPDETDVAIVGSGFAGLSAALALARAGRSVAVFEKDRLGEGASTRNGGIASGNIKIGFGRMIEAFGLDRAKRIYAEGREAREDLQTFIGSEAIDCRYDLVGRFTGAMKPRHYESLGHEADLLNKHLEIGAFMVSRADQHGEIGTAMYHGGMVRPDIGGLHPGLLYQGMLEKALEAGANIYSRTAVRGIQQDRNEFEILTQRGPIVARDVIVATNGYTGAATPWLRRRIIPIPSQIIVTEPLSKDLMDRLMPRRRMLGETRHIYHYYRPSPDGDRIVFGGRAGAGTDDPIAKYKHLRRNLIELFPELENVRITHSWWGYTGYTFDFLPKLVVHEGVRYATGFCGSGVVWAQWIGKKAAWGILGRREAKTAFDETNFPCRPFYFGRPWFLPLVIGWYGLKDRMGL